MKPRQTIKTLAAEIMERWPALKVRVERGHCNTDRMIGRLRWPGKGRYASHITVIDAYGKVILDHNNAQTYRTTDDVRRWIDARIAAGRKKRRK